MFFHTGIAGFSYHDRGIENSNRPNERPGRIYGGGILCEFSGATGKCTWSNDVIMAGGIFQAADRIICFLWDEKNHHFLVEGVAGTVMGIIRNDYFYSWFVLAGKQVVSKRRLVIIAVATWTCYCLIYRDGIFVKLAGNCFRNLVS